MKKFSCIVFFLFFCSSYGFAKDWYVLSGKQGKGTRENPLGSIQDALNEASSGDVIHIAQGFYMGEGGVGKWIIRIPRLTLVGGYDAHFKERNPFKYHTVLMRGMNEFGALSECQKKNHEQAHPFTVTKSDYNVGAMIQGASNSMESHEYTILDGLILDGHSRNLYKEDGSLRLDKGSTAAPLVDFTALGCRVRNCMFLNSAGFGIRMAAMGFLRQEETCNEVSNCLFVNVLMAALNFEIGEGVALVRNNTIVFVWEHLNNGYGIIIGKASHLIVEKNIFIYSSRAALHNPRLNRSCQLKENIFWQSGDGHYRYFSPNSLSFQIVDEVQKLSGKEARLRYCLSSKSEGNQALDPKLPIDSSFLSITGKASGSKQNLYAPVYELSQAFLFSSEPAMKGAGAQKEASFRVYSSKSPKKEKRNYIEIPYKEVKDLLFDKIKAEGSKGLSATVELQLHPIASAEYYLPHITSKEYHAFRSKELLLYIYVPKGSKALRILSQARSKGEKVKIKGLLVDISDETKVAKSVAIIVDEVEEEEE